MGWQRVRPQGMASASSKFVFARKQGHPCQGTVTEAAARAAAGAGEEEWGHGLGGGWEPSPIPCPLLAGMPCPGKG